MVKLPWAGPNHSPGADWKSLPLPDRGFLSPRPLYGSRDAPMRWFIKLSESPTAACLRQLKADVCISTRLTSAAELEGIAVVHVGDILFAGSDSFLTTFITVLKQFRTGEVETLSCVSPITFAGLFIGECPKGTLLLPQHPYIMELPKMDVAQYVDQSRIVKENELRSTFRQGLGALIWIRQTRPDVGFSIARMATDIPTARKDVDKCLLLARGYNK